MTYPGRSVTWVVVVVVVVVMIMNNEKQAYDSLETEVHVGCVILI
jgi:hypothetical protein